MNFQGKTGLIAIGASILLLVGVMFVLFRTTLGERPHNVSPDNAPDYAKQSGMTKTGGAPTGPRAAPYSQPPNSMADPRGGSSYGGPAGGNEPGRAPQ